MPYRVVKRGEKWCVVKKDDGTTLACHDTQDLADAQIRAVMAHEMDDKIRAGAKKA
ncbi:hypothetical protein ACGFXC_10465 [Streptomyces sp. NPDC048507]|uniref:hypothetical protein n=1 Tax=Streptomyces sp. NPDC048507 TaxID=3365560 RepID=UPI00371A889D